MAESRPAVERIYDDSIPLESIDSALREVKDAWRERLASHRIESPDASLNCLVNDWVRYQAVSARLWGRAGYYQQSGAFGFRDQLQDSQVWLTIDPQLCREQISLHAAHQFTDGSVYHWWHPLSEQGHVTTMTDDLLWLAFVTANYIRETGDLSVLWDESPFLDDRRPYPLIDHVQRAFDRVFQRTSPRGLPFIGAGDWNDGLSAVGLLERGESIWLAEFLVGLLADWSKILRRVASITRSPEATIAVDQALERADDFEKRCSALIAAINQHAWDGEWYIRATLDDGSKLGSKENRVGRIFLNAQTWAILNDVAPPDRARLCMESVKRHLVRDEVGPLLLAPAFDKPVSEIGYITRYAPGLRENGGVYMHAATWAIAAACKVRDAALVGRLLRAINPVRKDPESYWAEPYVLPGNVDGPDSPHFGRAGWTWYTGAAQWLHRVVTHWVFGVRPDWNCLRVDPCLPPEWTTVHMTRPWRGCTYRFEIRRAPHVPVGEVEVSLNTEKIASGEIPPPAQSHRIFHVLVQVPKTP
jgi:cellobiose phosphorylase